MPPLCPINVHQSDHSSRLEGKSVGAFAFQMRIKVKAGVILDDRNVLMLSRFKYCSYGGQTTCSLGPGVAVDRSNSVECQSRWTLSDLSPGLIFVTLSLFVAFHRVSNVHVEYKECACRSLFLRVFAHKWKPSPAVFHFQV